MYKTWMSTPDIDISGRTTDKIFMSFNSSWRPYFEGASNTEIYINLSYDGGDPVQILNWVSDPNSEKHHGDNQNELVVLPLTPPQAARKVKFTFGMREAGNDWWWAIDNVKVYSPPSYTEPYQIIEGSFTWHEAKADAEARGGHLATITSQAEQNAITNILVKDYGRSRIWVGATDELVEGDWKWVTGEPFDFVLGDNPFDNAGGEPGEDYLQISSNGGAWNDWNGPEIVGYILETQSDTDGDGFPDKLEATNGYDPLDGNNFGPVEKIHAEYAYPEDNLNTEFTMNFTDNVGNAESKNVLAGHPSNYFRIMVYNDHGRFIDAIRKSGGGGGYCIDGKLESVAGGYWNGHENMQGDHTLKVKIHDNKFEIELDGQLFNTGTVSPDRLFDSQISPKKVVVEHLKHAYSHSEPKFITSGDLLWSFETGGEIWSSPSIDFDGTIYIGSSNNKVYAISPDGAKEWEFETGGEIHSAPSIGFDGT
ncbi:MAG TPA: PQQ-binding-like beta-propeller repeat protein, partial [Candidatus Marinimicrobia bacterium]|nr:PQQ-binding-like beta-propeller repeat protein [Candidatus Neomarinimicrobiota bacterium]